MRRSGALGASASDAVRDLLTGPPGDTRVLAAFPAAVYLAHRHGVLAVVARDGIHHPNAVAVTATTAERPFAGIDAGMSGHLGDHAVGVGDLQVTIGRWWRASPAVVPVAAATLRAAADHLEQHLVAAAPPLPQDLATALARLYDALARGDAAAANTHAVALLGLGPGLTPSGDDLLSGLFAAVALLAPALDDVTLTMTPLRAVGTSIAARATTATTAISAALLGHAVAGQVSDVAARVIAGLVGTRPLPPAVDDLLAVGATSGRDLAAGMLVGTRLVVDLADRTATPAAHIFEEAT